MAVQQPNASPPEKPAPSAKPQKPAGPAPSNEDSGVSESPDEPAEPEDGTTLSDRAREEESASLDSEGEITEDGDVVLTGPDGEPLELGEAGDGMDVSVAGPYFTASGPNSAIVGTIGENGEVRWTRIPGTEGLAGEGERVVTSINEQGQLVVAGPNGVVLAEVRDGRVVTLPHDPIVLGGSQGDGGVDAAINEQGQFVVAGPDGAVVGQIGPDGAAYEELHDLGVWSDGQGVAVDINESGQFLVAGNEGVQFGQISPSGNVYANPPVRDIDVGTHYSPVGAALNDRGQFVVAGDTGVVVGQMDQHRPEWSSPLEGDWDPRLTQGAGGRVGVAINESGVFVAVGNDGVVSGTVQGQEVEWIQEPGVPDFGGDGSSVAVSLEGDRLAVAGEDLATTGHLFGTMPIFEPDVELRPGSGTPGAGMDEGNFAVAGSGGVLVGQRSR
ncbi:MAG: hypothetical protein AB1758_32840 [Candidatus Eremiobacterota bacterium]